MVDSDYVVRPDWLRAMVPYFERAEIGFVQSPQDHRDWRGNPFKEMINWEYAGFFRIGMVHRNERDAIIEHGTMTLIRKSAMDQVGNWAEWCICEDAELGLKLMEAGWQSAYCTEIFGRKNDLGSSPEMVLRQKSDIRPSAYRDSVETPFRSSDLPTGVLSRNNRPEYGAAYRKAAAAIQAARRGRA